MNQPTLVCLLKIFLFIICIISITQAITKTIDNQLFGCGIDTVNNDIPHLKLEHYGIRDVANSWLKSYLSDRKQYVSLNGVDS